MILNAYGVAAIYRFEMNRWLRTLGQSLLAPVLSTTLYFAVFGAAIGGRMEAIDGIAYGAFIVPGLVMLAVLTESVSNASFGIYMPKWAGTIYELLSAPVSAFEAVLGYVGAAVTKSLAIAAVILITARFFVAYEIQHPLPMLAFLVLTTIAFCLFGFILGLWADGWEKLQIVPLLVITPLAFLGGTFYSIDILPSPWREISLFNPIVYLVSGFRWSFFGEADVSPWISLGATAGFLAACLGTVWWIFKTGWRLRP